MLNRPATMNAVIERLEVCARLGACLPRFLEASISSNDIKASRHSSRTGMHSSSWHNKRLKLTDSSGERIQTEMQGNALRAWPAA